MRRGLACAGVVHFDQVRREPRIVLPLRSPFQMKKVGTTSLGMGCSPTIIWATQNTPLSSPAAPCKFGLRRLVLSGVLRSAARCRLCVKSIRPSGACGTSRLRDGGWGMGGGRSGQFILEILDELFSASADQGATIDEDGGRARNLQCLAIRDVPLDGLACLR